MVTAGEADEYQIVSSQLTIEALRDSGYSSTTHAVAELVDNAVEAEASTIDVLCCERSPEPGTKHARARVDQIVVADNGKGMDAETLRRGLKFGDGSRLKNPTGIGRFGIGLPASSVSQARRVDVWTWRNGATNALHSYLDLDEVNRGETAVPAPQHNEPPRELLELTRVADAPSGTLVIWSKLDRIEFKTAATIIRHASPLVGRIYRNFISKGSVSIHLVPCRDGVANPPHVVLPNDPLFLTTPCGTPPPFDQYPMFEPFGSPQLIQIDFEEDGEAKQGVVTVRCSHARKEARVQNKDVLVWPAKYSVTQDAGGTPWGKAAERERGVSLVRAGREILLDTSWTSSSDPTDRWWSIEVSFGPELDSVFGTITNKQSATIFAKGSSWNIDAEKLDGEDDNEYIMRLRDEGDRRAPLLGLWLHIVRQRKLMKAAQKLRGKSRGDKRHPNPNDTSTPKSPPVDDVASAFMDSESSEGIVASASEQEGLNVSAEEREEKILDNLTNRHKMDHDEARKRLEEIVLNNRRVNFIAVDDPNAGHFFAVETLPDLVQVVLNESHVAYETLSSTLEDIPDDADADDLRDRLAEASDAVKLLLFAWAFMEDRQTLNKPRHPFSDMRNDWGRAARDLFYLYRGAED